MELGGSLRLLDDDCPTVEFDVVVRPSRVGRDRDGAIIPGMKRIEIASSVAICSMSLPGLLLNALMDLTTIEFAVFVVHLGPFARTRSRGVVIQEE